MEIFLVMIWLIILACVPLAMDNGWKRLGCGLLVFSLIVMSVVLFNHLKTQNMILEKLDKIVTEVSE